MMGICLVKETCYYSINISDSDSDNYIVINNELVNTIIVLKWEKLARISFNHITNGRGSSNIMNESSKLKQMSIIVSKLLFQ